MLPLRAEVDLGAPALRPGGPVPHAAHPAACPATMTMTAREKKPNKRLAKRTEKDRVAWEEGFGRRVVLSGPPMDTSALRTRCCCTAAGGGRAMGALRGWILPLGGGNHPRHRHHLFLAAADVIADQCFKSAFLFL